MFLSHSGPTGDPQVGLRVVASFLESFFGLVETLSGFCVAGLIFHCAVDFTLFFNFFCQNLVSSHSMMCC